LHTALDSFELQGHVPETIVSGQTSDISPFIEYVWFDWIMYFNQAASFPDLKQHLGQWLGPAVDLVLARTAKILKMNGQIKCGMIFCEVVSKVCDPWFPECPCLVQSCTQ
jgi:hypothetical protein